MQPPPELQLPFGTEFYYDVFEMTSIHNHHENENSTITTLLSWLRGGGSLKMFLISLLNINKCTLVYSLLLLDTKDQDTMQENPQKKWQAFIFKITILHPITFVFILNFKEH